MPAPENNRYAAKPDSEKGSGARIVINCHPRDKARIVRHTQARGEKLSPWALQQLLAALEQQPGDG